MSSYTVVSGGQVIYPAYVSYLFFELTGNINLNWPSDFQNSNSVVPAIMDVQPSADGFSITLPDARQTSTGQSFLLNNTGSHSFSLKANDGTVILAPVNASTVSYFYLIDNTTQAGVWIYTPWGGGGSSITSVALSTSSTSGNITVSPAYLSPGNPITTTGTFTLGLGADLAALTGFGSSLGIAVRTASTPTWVLRSIAGTANQINIANPLGTAGNPTISLATNISGPQSIRAANILIGGAGGLANTIQAINANGNIDFTTPFPGTGTANFDMPLTLKPVGVDAGEARFYNQADTFYTSIFGGNVSANVPLILPSVAPTTTQVLSCTDGATGELGWANVTTFGGSSTLNAIAKFTNTTGSIGNSGVIIDSSNNITGANSLTLPQLKLDNATISTQSSDQNIIMAPNGIGQVQIPVGLEATPSLTFTGVTNTGIWSDGTGISFSALGKKQFDIAPNGSAANCLQVQGSAGTNPLTITAVGTGANVNIQLVPKGVGIVQVADGSASLPGYAFIGGASGMYLPVAGQLGFSTGGVEQVRIDSAGNVGIGVTSFGTSAAKVLSLAVGTAPSTAVSSSTQLFAFAPSGGNASLGWYGEGNGGVTTTAVANTFVRNIAVQINGTTYFIPAKLSDT